MLKSADFPLVARKIHISESTYSILKIDSRYQLTERGTVSIKVRVIWKEILILWSCIFYTPSYMKASQISRRLGLVNWTLETALQRMLQTFSSFLSLLLSLRARAWWKHFGYSENRQTDRFCFCDPRTMSKPFFSSFIAVVTNFEVSLILHPLRDTFVLKSYVMTF